MDFIGETDYKYIVMRMLINKGLLYYWSRPNKLNSRACQGINTDLHFGLCPLWNVFIRAPAPSHRLNPFDGSDRELWVEMVVLFNSSALSDNLT